MNNIYFLNRVPLFSALDQLELERISPLFKDKLCEDGEILFKEGDPEEGLYIIEKGLVKAIQKVKDGGEKVVASFGIRDFLGEMALLGGEHTHTVTVKSLGPTKLLFLPRQDYEALSKDETSITIKLLTAITLTIEKRLRASHEEIVNLANWGKELRGIQTRFREVIDGGEEIRIVLTNDRALVGRIEAYEEGIGKIEILFRDSTDHLFVVPYHAIQYFIIQQTKGQEA